MKKLTLVLCLLLSMSVFALAEELGQSTMPEVNAELAARMINGNSSNEEILDAFDRTSLERLRQIIQEDLAKGDGGVLRTPPTSSAMRWAAMGIIYDIDDRLGELKYDRIIYGQLIPLLGGFAGVGNYKILQDNGQILDDVIVTVGTINRENDESGHVKLYVKENTADKYVHLEVIKIENTPYLPETDGYGTDTIVINTNPAHVKQYRNNHLNFSFYYDPDYVRATSEGDMGDTFYLDHNERIIATGSTSDHTHKVEQLRDHLKDCQEMPALEGFFKAYSLCSDGIYATAKHPDTGHVLSMSYKFREKARNLPFFTHIMRSYTPLNTKNMPADQ